MKWLVYFPLDENREELGQQARGGRRLKKERKRKENEIRMKVEESGGLSARDPLPPRPLFAVESGLKKKGKNENA